MPFTILPLTADHLDQVVAIHLARFPEDFITSLGRGWLRRVFYPAYLELAGGFGFVAVGENTVRGYIVGSEDSRSFYAQMLRWRTFGLAWSFLWAALRRPRMIKRALAVRRTVRAEPEPPAPADLSYVALKPGSERRGIGAALVSALADYLRARGHEGCWVKGWADNPQTDGFYQAAGFRPVQDYYSDGRHWRLYVLDLVRP
ncbi:MAG: GNAT family N-acetyltransferase [Proteobacteria bacterium]|nr:GNAT family N-acetyltransferase [Pseudomonadota bacterium]MBU1741084.1 GNAT family N-acetyltransferase [Pseudomonadota bacterium]